MHTAYKAQQLLKLPLGIECLKAIGDHLLVGTKQGHLLMYSVSFEGSSSEETNGVHIQLLRSNKNFSKKPIVQLEAVSEYSILIALSDNIITVHDIDLSVTNFPVITTCSKTKGATGFSLDIVRQKSLTGETACTVRMVVAVRRKLQLYYWKNRKFLELQPDISVADVPRSLSWHSDAICVGYRADYSLIKLNSTMQELFPTGKNQDPIVTYISNKRFAAAKDEQTIFVDSNDGQVALEPITWSEVPVGAIAFDAPYLLACLQKTVEIRTEVPKLSIQCLELARPRILATVHGKPGIVYVASSSHIWCLRMVPVSVQIPQLLRDKQFELAVTLCDHYLEDKAHKIQHIQTLYAFDLFCNFKFKESMDVFYKLDIDASHVIGLYSDLLPHEFRNQLQYPDKLPKLQGRDMENGYGALVEYLTSVRHKLQGSSVKIISPMTIMEGSMVVKSKKQIMQIIDTTLLKCYLKINDSLVASLLRLKGNYCHLEETERALKKCHKYSELVIFYNTMGLHRKALSLLKEQSEEQESPLYGHTKTVQYLQNLPPQDIDLVCEYAGPVLEAAPEQGLAIFTEDLLEVESWPRHVVLEFLNKKCRKVVIPYLEHVITTWHENKPLFHNALILHYKDLVVQLSDKSLLTTTDVVEEEEDGNNNMKMLTKTRKKLRELLLSSVWYTADTVLPQFPLHCLHEERALLLGSLGRHKEALALYLYQVHDLSEAMAYCNKHYEKGSHVYSTLYQLLVQPPEPVALKAMYVSTANAHTKCQPDIQTALDLLQQHSDKIDLKVVLTATPSTVPLAHLAAYLETAIGDRVSKRHQLQLLRGLMHAEHLQVQEERIAVESQKVVLDECDVCHVCGKRFCNQSTIVRLTSGRVVHYSC